MHSEAAQSKSDAQGWKKSAYIGTGNERFSFEAIPEPRGRAWGRLVQLLEDHSVAGWFDLTGLGATVGRQRGDIVFDADPFLSREHCRIVGDLTGFYLEDLGSYTGTYRLVHPREVVPFGTVLMLEQTTVRVKALLARRGSAGASGPRATTRAHWRRDVIKGTICHGGVEQSRSDDAGLGPVGMRRGALVRPARADGGQSRPSGR